MSRRQARLFVELMVTVAQLIDCRLFLKQIVSEREQHSTAAERSSIYSFVASSYAAKVHPTKVLIFYLLVTLR